MAWRDTGLRTLRSSGPRGKAGGTVIYWVVPHTRGRFTEVTFSPPKSHGKCRFVSLVQICFLIS